MRDAFTDPPKDVRMLQILHGLGRLRGAGASFDDLARRLDEGGYGGAVINVDFSDEYLESEPEWQTFIEGFDALRARDLCVWVYDEKGYPSLKAGGIVLRDRPELEAIGMAYAETTGRGAITHRLPGDDETDRAPLCAVALPVSDSGVRDLTSAVPVSVEPGDENITWDAPDGLWSVMSFHRHVAYAGTHCTTNLSDPGRYPNILDPEATEHFLHVTHDEYARRLGARFSEVDALFTDEPSTMTAYLQPADTAIEVVPWSRSFEAAFAARAGGDVRDVLPALFVDCGPAGAYARVSFWRVVAELIEENFYGLIEAWAEEHGTLSSGHALLEEPLFWHVGYEGNLYRDLRRMQLPGIDMLSSYPQELSRHAAMPVPKLVSSVTHMIGARQCMSETSSHVQRTHEQPVSFEQRVGTINWQYVQGLNLITSYYGMEEMPPGDMRRFTEHIARLGAMLTDGRHIADVAVYYPIATAWAAYEPTREPWAAPGEQSATVDRRFADACNTLLRGQRDFDILDDEALLEADIAGEALRIHDEAFRCVVVPGAELIPRDVFQKLGRFAASGGRVIFIEPAPEMGLSPGETEAIMETWPGLLDAKHVARVAEPAQALGALDEWLAPDVALDEPCDVLLYCHREKDGRHVYFLANCAEEPVERTVTFRCAGRPERWHPTTGEITPIPSALQADGVTSIDLQLEPYEGYFIVF